MSKSNFLFRGTPADVPELMRVVFAQGFRCLATGLLRGRPQYFDEWGPQLASVLERQGFVFLVGEFTIDVRPRTAAPSFVDDSSGPILKFGAPSVSVAFRHQFLRNYWTAKRNRPGDDRLNFHPGLVRVQPQYFYPSTPGRDPEKEARSAFRHLVTALKKVMIEHNGEWFGMTAYEWAMSGPYRLL